MSTETKQLVILLVAINVTAVACYIIGYTDGRRKYTTALPVVKDNIVRKGNNEHQE